MRMTDAFLNYWILFDVFNYYYAFDTVQPYLPDQRVEILDGDGNVVTTIKMIKVLFTSIGDLNLSFTSNTPEFNTFDLGLVINQLEIKQDFESSY